MEETTNQRVLVLADLEALENEHDKTNAFLVEHSSAILDVANFEIGRLQKMTRCFCTSVIQPLKRRSPNWRSLVVQLVSCLIQKPSKHGLAIKFPKILKRLLKSC